MDKIDYLLLHYVCELKIPVADLYRDDLEIALNLPHHHLSKQQVKVRLDGLHSARLIDFFDYEYHTSRQFYGLTAAGGQAWSQLFQPNWQRFVYYSGDMLSETQEAVTLVGFSRERVVEVLQQLGSNSEKTQIHTLSDWQGLYWQTPCTGYVFADIFALSQTEKFTNTDWHLSWETATANLT